MLFEPLPTICQRVAGWHQGHLLMIQEVGALGLTNALGIVESCLALPQKLQRGRAPTNWRRLMQIAKQLAYQHFSENVSNCLQSMPAMARMTGRVGQAFQPANSKAGWKACPPFSI